MKPILMILASLVLLVLVFLSGVIVTAHVIAEPEPHKFANIDTPDLWTSKPEAIKPAGQTYERMPASKSVQSAAATTSTTTADESAFDTASTTASISPPFDTPMGGNSPVPHEAPATETALQQQPAVDTAQAEWCYARYCSYRIEDNSYQPYDGGGRRQCHPPFSSTQSEPVSQDAVYTEEPGYGVEAETVASEPVESGELAGNHEEWCLARYRSYRIEDNSYQPFEGGARRMCQSPFG